MSFNLRFLRLPLELVTSATVAAALLILLLLAPPNWLVVCLSTIMDDYGVDVSGLLLLPFFIEASEWSFTFARRESDLRCVVCLVLFSGGEFGTFCG